MKPKTVLRICLVLEWDFFVAGLVASIGLEHLLPEPLRSWLTEELERDLGSIEKVLLFLFIPLIVSELVSSVGLFFMRRWAAWLYLGTTAIGVLCAPLSGPVVLHPISDTLNTLIAIMIGMVISLAFFTDAVKRPSSE